MRAAEELKLSAVTLNTLSDKYDGNQWRAGPQRPKQFEVNWIEIQL